MTPAELFAQLSEHPVVRRVAWLGFLSWVTALTLTGYVFGLSDGFFGRLFSATFVLWLLALGSTYGIRPLIGWLTRRLSGTTPDRRPAKPRKPSGSSTSGSRNSNRPNPTGSTAAPANKWR
jgi:hypothetical protein